MDRRRPYAFLLECATSGPETCEALGNAAAALHEKWVVPLVETFPSDVLEVELDAQPPRGATAARYAYRPDRWPSLTSRIGTRELAHLTLDIELTSEREVVNEWQGLAGPRILVHVSSANGDGSFLLVHIAHCLVVGADDPQAEVVAMAKRCAVDIRVSGGTLSANFLERPMPARRREPFRWAAFLGPVQLRALGGRTRVISECPAHEVDDLSTSTHELVYVQATSRMTDIPAEDALTEESTKEPALDAVARVQAFLSNTLRDPRS